MATSNIPVPRSFNQIVGGMIDAFLASYGLKALKVGSPVLSMFEAAAESDLRNSQDIFSMLRATTLAQAAGTALDRLAADEGTSRQTNTFASGAVTVTDTSFTKISSSVYQGLPAPIAGVSVVNVVDASNFPASGSIYLGRGTNNYEGPLDYSSVTQNGVYWQVNLSVGVTTQNFHNVGETVIVAQGGNRQVPAGNVVQTPQGNASTSTQFKVLYTANLPDGETEIDGVQVVAIIPGIGGNVQNGTITQFVASPFTGAAVTNPLPFNNALAAETDDQLRERIRELRASRAQGTVLAVTTGVIGATSPDENKTITSSSYVPPQLGNFATLYIDDGTGYEEIYTGVALENIVSQASGGEQYFQVASDPPVTKARIVSSIVAPYNVLAGSILAVSVGGVLYQHSFSAADFQNPLAASAYEVVASINADSAIAFQALTSDTGTTVTIVAKADTNESVQIASDQLAPGAVDANTSFQFPVGLVDTMRLYRNDRLLSKDGQVASVRSRPVSTWGLFNPVETLVLQVDGTSSPVQVPLALGTATGSLTGFSVTAVQVPLQPNSIVILVNGTAVGADNGLGIIVGTALAAGSSVNYTSGTITVNFLTAPISGAVISAYYVTANNGPVPVFTLTAQSFINAGTGFTSVGINSMAAWCAVLNATIPGVTATPSGSTLTLTSNLGASPRAKLVISGGTLLGKIFNLVSSTGVANDYKLNRNLGQISLVVPLSNGDTLSAGSLYTRAFVQSPSIPLTPTSPIPNITGSGANWWFVADGDAQLVQTGLSAGAQLTYSVSAMENWGARVRLTSTTAAAIFQNVQFSDWLVAWDTGLAGNNQGQWRIDNVDPLGTWVEIGRQSLPMAGSGMTATLLQNGVSVLVVGGFRPLYNDFSGEAVIYNTTTGSVTVVGSLGTPRGYHTASLLPSGKVLVAGGLGASTFGSLSVNGPQTLSSAEIYDPTAMTWSAAASMPGPLSNHKAVVMDAGGGSLANWVAVAGGYSAIGTITANAYYYNPTGNTWTTLPNMLQARAYHQMLYVTGSPGYILVVGGTANITSSFLSECEILNLTTLTWSTTGSLSAGRFGHRTRILSDGTIITVGGFYSHSIHGYATTQVTETFGGSTWTTQAPSLLTHVFAQVAAVESPTSTPQLLASSGAFAGFLVLQGASFSELYDKNSNTWSLIPNPLQPNRFDGATVTLGSGQQVAMFGGTTGPNGYLLQDSTTPLTVASAEVYTTTTMTAPINGVVPVANTWYPIVDATLGIQTLANAGMVVISSLGEVQRVTVPAQTNVLAPVLAAAFTAQLEGASALVYQTQEVRVNTNTFDLSGDIALVTADVQAQQFGLPTGSAIVNLPSHQPAVSTGNSELGTPNFQTLSVTSVLSPTEIQLTTGSLGQEGNEVLSSGSTFVGLQDFFDENIGINGSQATLQVLSRFGSNFGFASTISSQTENVGLVSTIVNLNRTVPVEWMPEDRVYAASPWCLSPTDTLTVVLDNNPESLRFVIPMYRRLRPATSTYGTTNQFLDLDNPLGGSPQSLAVAFGTTVNTPPNGFDFTDFAVFMKARVITDPSSINAMLWRYYRWGEEGNLAQIRYDYAKVANQPTATVTTDMYGLGIGGTSTAYTTNISVVLPSGVARTGMKLRNSTRVGVSVLINQGPNTDLYKYVFAFGLQVVTADRGITLAGTDTLTLTLPPGITDHGLQVGNNVFWQSPDSNFATRVYTITGRTATTIQFADSGANYGPVSNDGEISYDVGDATLAPSNITAGPPADVFSTNSLAFNSIQSGPQNIGTYSGSLITFTPTLLPGFIQSGSLQVFIGSTLVATALSTGFFQGVGIYASYISGHIFNTNAGTLTITFAASIPALTGAVTMTWTTSPVAFQNVTMGLQYYDSNQVIEGYTDTSLAQFGTGTTLLWFPAGNVNGGFSWYPVGTANTITAIATAVNALAALPNSTCPITALALPGQHGLRHPEHHRQQPQPRRVLPAHGRQELRAEHDGALAGERQLQLRLQGPHQLRAGHRQRLAGRGSPHRPHERRHAGALVEQPGCHGSRQQRRHPGFGGGPQARHRQRHGRQLRGGPGAGRQRELRVRGGPELRAEHQRAGRAGRRGCLHGVLGRQRRRRGLHRWHLRGAAEHQRHAAHAPHQRHDGAQHHRRHRRQRQRGSGGWRGLRDPRRARHLLLAGGVPGRVRRLRVERRRHQAEHERRAGGRLRLHHQRQRRLLGGHRASHGRGLRHLAGGARRLRDLRLLGGEQQRRSCHGLRLHALPRERQPATGRHRHHQHAHLGRLQHGHLGRGERRHPGQCAQRPAVHRHLVVPAQERRGTAHRPVHSPERHPPGGQRPAHSGAGGHAVAPHQEPRGHRPEPDQRYAPGPEVRQLPGLHEGWCGGRHAGAAPGQAPLPHGHRQWHRRLQPLRGPDWRSQQGRLRRHPGHDHLPGHRRRRREHQPQRAVRAPHHLQSGAAHQHQHGHAE